MKNDLERILAMTIEEWSKLEIPDSATMFPPYGDIQNGNEDFRSIFGPFKTSFIYGDFDYYSEIYTGKRFDELDCDRAPYLIEEFPLRNMIPADRHYYIGGLLICYLKIRLENETLVLHRAYNTLYLHFMHEFWDEFSFWTGNESLFLRLWTGAEFNVFLELRDLLMAPGVADYNTIDFVEALPTAALYNKLQQLETS